MTAPAYGTAWAVGDGLERWDGTRWRATPLELPSNVTLEGVSADSPHDGWITGHDPSGGPIALRYARGSWQAVPMPRPGPSFPHAVSARTPRDAWIVGNSSGFAGTQGQAWHWDGTAWEVKPVQGALGSDLATVSARTAKDVWAAGANGLVVRWNGADWVRTPAPVADYTGIVALARNDVWAVGSRQAAPDPADRPAAGTRAARHDVPVTAHWDGARWQIVDPPAQATQIRTVAGDGVGGVWVGGTTVRGRTLLAHRTPTGWDAESGLPRGAALSLALQTDGSALWAVGVNGHKALALTNGPRPR